MGNIPQCFCLNENNKESNKGEIVIGKGAYKFKKIVFIYII